MLGFLDDLDRKSWGFTSIDLFLDLLERNCPRYLKEKWGNPRVGFFSGLILTLSGFKAFSSLAEAAYEAADVADDQEEPATYCLSSSFELIVQKLLETTDR